MITTRTIIHDTHAAHVEDLLSGNPSGNMVHLTAREFDALHSAFAQLGSRMGAHEYGAHFHGREYTLLGAQSRVQLSSGGGLRAELTFVRAGDSAQRWIHCTYSLYTHANGARVCAFIGNPTTLIAGSNVRPVRVDDVGHMGETLTFFRVGFDFLCALFPAFGWSTGTAARIATGDIAVSNTQWALYLPTADKQRDLALLSGLYCARLNAVDTSTSLCEHLGFSDATPAKNDAGALTGLFLTRRAGRNHVLSINFYDKRASIAAKHQGNALEPGEAELIANSLRLDITAHTRWLETMIRAAQRHIDVLETAKPGLRVRLARFCETTTPTAARVARAMNLLGYTVRNGTLVHVGFTAWLLQQILDRELRLISLLRCTLDVLHVDHADPVCAGALRVWRTEPAGCIYEAIARACGCSARTARRAAARLIADCAVDVDVPYRYWLGYLAASLTYGLDSTAAVAVLGAVYGGGDPAARVAALDAANATRARALEESRASLLHSIGVVARAVEATPLVALLAGDDSLWTDPRVVWDRVHVDGVHVG